MPLVGRGHVNRTRSCTHATHRVPSSPEEGGASPLHDMMILEYPNSCFDSSSILPLAATPIFLPKVSFAVPRFGGCGPKFLVVSCPIRRPVSPRPAVLSGD